MGTRCVSKAREADKAVEVGQQGQALRCDTHFVGFRGDEFWSAVRVWGYPDFYHRVFDGRALAEFCPGDTVIFANSYEEKFTKWSFNDSEHF